jgi:hypothetical protein
MKYSALCGRSSSRKEHVGFLRSDETDGFSRTAVASSQTGVTLTTV